MRKLPDVEVNATGAPAFTFAPGTAERDFTSDDCAERALQGRGVRRAGARAARPSTTRSSRSAPIAPASPSPELAVVAPPHADRAWPWLQIDLAAAVEAALSPTPTISYASGTPSSAVHRRGARRHRSRRSRRWRRAGHAGRLERREASRASPGRHSACACGRADVATSGSRPMPRSPTSLLDVRGLGMYGAQSDFGSAASAGEPQRAVLEFWVVPIIAVFAAAQLDVVPDTYNLTRCRERHGAGTTPGWWLGGKIGATGRFSLKRSWHVPPLLESRDARCEPGDFMLLTAASTEVATAPDFAEGLRSIGFARTTRWISALGGPRADVEDLVQDSLRDRAARVLRELLTAGTSSAGCIVLTEANGARLPAPRVVPQHLLAAARVS